MWKHTTIRFSVFTFPFNSLALTIKSAKLTVSSFPIYYNVCPFNYKSTYPCSKDFSHSKTHCHSVPAEAGLQEKINISNWAEKGVKSYCSTRHGACCHQDSATDKSRLFSLLKGLRPLNCNKKLQLTQRNQTFLFVTVCLKELKVFLDRTQNT